MSEFCTYPGLTSTAIGEFLVEALTLETPCQCLLARDGFQAIEQVRTLPPDLLLVDYHLPNMNRLELYDYLHEREEFRHVLALFMSANLLAKKLKKRQLGTIPKPFELEELIQRVKTILAEPPNA